MMFSALLCIACYLTASLSENPIVALLGCSICGFSVGVMWPGTFSLGAERISDGGTAMFALLALFGDLGCATGPAAVGVLASQFGDNLSKGLVFGSFFPLLLCTMLMSKSFKNKES